MCLSYKFQSKGQKGEEQDFETFVLVSILKLTWHNYFALITLINSFSPLSMYVCLCFIMYIFFSFVLSLQKAIICHPCMLKAKY